jgi:hypothetical protein
MRTVMTVLGATLILSSIMLGGCATGKYVPTQNEELYGTWINDQPPAVGKKTVNAQKVVISADKYKVYYHVSDDSAMSEGMEVITSKWTDSAGNIWCKALLTYTAGNFNGTKNQMLYKLSKSATVLELEWSMVGDFDPSQYPTEVDSKDSEYGILYRAEK